MYLKSFNLQNLLSTSIFSSQLLFQKDVYLQLSAGYVHTGLKIAADFL